MRIFLFLILFLVFSYTIPAQDLRHTSWLVYLAPDDADYLLFHFHEDTMFWSFEDLVLHPLSLFRVDGMTFTINDLHKANTCNPEVAGIYELDFVFDHLRFIPIVDSCSIRLRVLSTFTWVRHSTSSRNNMSAEFKVYPNPLDNQLVVYLRHFYENGTYLMYDILGRCVKKGIINFGINKIDMQDLPAGNYYLKVQAFETVSLIKR